MKIIFRCLIILFAALIISSCCGPVCPYREPRFTNPCDEMVYNLSQKTAVTIIKRGDTLRIILPVDAYFEPASTKIRLDAESLLYQIGLLVQCGCYNEMPIRVLGYTDNIGTISEQRQRSLQQAENIASYLWAQGVPRDRITVRGFGARGTLSSNATPHGEADNRRVEIRIP